MEIKDIKTIIELMKRNDLTHFELEREGVKLVLKRNMDPEGLASLMGSFRAAAPQSPPPAQAVLAPPTAPTPVAADADATASGGEGAAAGTVIKSPMVGTFYRSPGPGQDLFVKVGDYVEAETTVCIIEAMKVMNEIKAECSGKISRIAVEDASPVAYGQVLFELKPQA